MTAHRLADRIRADVLRSRAVELGRERGLNRPGIALVTGVATIVDGLMTLVAYLVVWLESSLGWVIDAALVPLALALALPYVGRAVAWVLSIVQTLLWAIVASPDGLLAVIGILPEKRLRVQVLLAAEADEGTRTKMLQALDVAAQIYRREANVRLMAAVPWAFRGAFSAPAAPTRDWLGEGDPGTSRLDVGCAVKAASEDIGRLGGTYAWRMLRRHLFGVARRILGAGAPIVIFPVHSVDEGRLVGCSLGPLTDYVTVAIDRPVCVAHELGHACNLLHVSYSDNMMNPTCGGVHLTRWQVVLVRLSRHVSYL